MSLSGRLAKLERNRPAHTVGDLELDLSPDLSEKIEAAKADGTFPQSLYTDDLRAIREAIAAALGQT